MSRFQSAFFALTLVVLGVSMFLFTAGMTLGTLPVNGGAPQDNQPLDSDDYPDNGSRTQRDPIPEGESVWEDYDDIQDSPRYKDRPGNYQALFALYDFLEGQYQVQPEYRQAGFPLYIGGNDPPIETKEDLETMYKQFENKIRASGRKKKNKIRQFNIDLKEIRLFDLHSGADLPPRAETKLTEKQEVRVLEIRRRHDGRGLLIRSIEQHPALQSDKIEGTLDGSYYWYMLVRSDGVWKVVWFPK